MTSTTRSVRIVGSTKAPVLGCGSLLSPYAPSPERPTSSVGAHYPKVRPGLAHGSMRGNTMLSSSGEARTGCSRRRKPSDY